MFNATVDTLRRDTPALQARWVDIEDEADLVGDLDIETFPTFLVVQGREVLFAGVITPQPGVLQRVLGNALARADRPPSPVDPAMMALAHRLADAESCATAAAPIGRG